MLDKGITFINDLYRDNNNLPEVIPFKEWVNKEVTPANFLIWLGLINRTKHVIHTGKQITAIADNLLALGDINVKHANSKKIYQYLLSNKYKYELNQPRINKYVECQDIEEDDWKTIFTRAQSVTEIKTREFQFKFLYDILSNNFWTHKWGITDSSACTFCDQNIENLSHLFWECPEIVRFWKNLNEYFSDKSGIILTKNNVYFGAENESMTVIAFYGKRYIYKCKFDSKLPTVQGLLNTLMYYKRIEYHSLTNPGKIEKHMERWRHIV